MTEGSLDSGTSIEASNPLGEKSPVRAIGHLKKDYYFINAVGELISLKQNEMSPRGVLTNLFLGDAEYLQKLGPPSRRQSNAAGDEATPWDHDAVVIKLMKGCRRAGFFDPSKQLRGIGVWPYSSELELMEGFEDVRTLIVHCGTELRVVQYAGGTVTIDKSPPGVRIGDYVYPAMPPDPVPADLSASEDEVELVLNRLSSWNYRDGDLIPWLLLGWLGTAYLPAGCPYRPTAWLQGPSQCGKSSLARYIYTLLMRSAAWYDDATPARLRDEFREELGAKPIIINEAEVSEDNRTLQKLIELARYCYTPGEGVSGRGGSDGFASIITANWLFACIEPPPLLAQDANRIVMARLDDLNITADDLEAFEEEAPAEARRLGPKLKRRMIEAWPLFPSVLNAYRKALIKAGHKARQANTFGVLLSAAWMLRYKSVPDETDVAEMVEQLDPRLLAARQFSLSPQEECLTHLLTFHLSKWRGGETQPVEELMQEYITGGEHADAAQRTLKRNGLAIVRRDDRTYLAIASNHSALGTVYKGTRWAGGSWASTLAMTRGAIGSAKVRFSGPQQRCTLIPQHYFRSPGGTMDEAGEVYLEGEMQEPPFNPDDWPQS